MSHVELVPRIASPSPASRPLWSRFQGWLRHVKGRQGRAGQSRPAPFDADPQAPIRTLVDPRDIYLA